MTTLNTLLALMCLSTTAWACDPSGGDMFFMGLIIAPFMAIPFTLFGTTVIASQGRLWFERPFVGWFWATIGAWLACTIGGVLGFGAAQLIADTSLHSENLESVLVLSSPLVVEIAYLMWLHARRPAEAASC